MNNEAERECVNLIECFLHISRNSKNYIRVGASLRTVLKIVEINPHYAPHAARLLRELADVLDGIETVEPVEITDFCVY